MNPINCPNCNKPLDVVATRILSNWYWDDDMDTYEEENAYTQERTQYCPHCKVDLEPDMGRIEEFDIEEHEP